MWESAGQDRRQGSSRETWWEPGVQWRQWILLKSTMLAKGLDMGNEGGIGITLKFLA